MKIYKDSGYIPNPETVIKLDNILQNFPELNNTRLYGKYEDTGVEMDGSTNLMTDSIELKDIDYLEHGDYQVVAAKQGIHRYIKNLKHAHIHHDYGVKNEVLICVAHKKDREKVHDKGSKPEWDISNPYGIIRYEGWRLKSNNGNIKIKSLENDIIEVCLERLGTIEDKMELDLNKFGRKMTY